MVKGRCFMKTETMFGKTNQKNKESGVVIVAEAVFEIDKENNCPLISYRITLSIEGRWILTSV
jgi:hypothetical protein